MSFIMFIAASMLEYISFFIFVLVLFRFSIRENILKFLLGSLILAFVSNTVQTESLQDISPLINVFILFFLITIILRTKLFHSFIMVTIGYVASALVQWLLVTLVIHFGVFDEIAPYTDKAYVMQALTFIVMCLVSFLIRAGKGGFSYIQSSSRFYKDSLRGNKMFVIFMILGLTVLFAGNIIYMTSFDRLSDSLATVCIIVVVLLIVMIYFSIRKDESE